MKAIQDQLSERIETGEQWDGMRVQGTWFHILRSFSHDKEIAKIGVMALAVYIVIKGHTDFSTGNAFPSVQEIAEQIGVKKDAVLDALKRLVEHGLLVVRKNGRSNHYSVVERVSIETNDGSPWATAERVYAGKEFGGFVDELQRLAKSGNLPTDRAITINLTVNVQNNMMGDNSTANQNVVEAPKKR